MTLDAASVAAWLQSHPDFFEAYPQVLGELQLPHPHGEHAVSLSERQLILLREKNRLLEQRMGEMIRYAEHNDSTSAKVHQLALQLMQSPDLPTLVPAVRQFMQSQFGVTQAIMRFWGPLREYDDPALPPVDPTLQSQVGELSAPYRGPAPAPGVQQWCEPTTPALLSFALLPLPCPAGHAGALLLAATDSTRFSPDMGAFYLTRMAELIGMAAWVLAQTPH